MPEVEPCPDCRALLPPTTALPTVTSAHRRPAGRSTVRSTWANRPLHPAPTTACWLMPMLPNTRASSPQAIQSVAVHLLTLYGILVQGMAPDQALWLRLRPLRDGKQPKHSRFVWLTPPSVCRQFNCGGHCRSANAGERAALVQPYVEEVWTRWAQEHQATIAQWYERFVLAETF
ncbi:MAG: DUF5946 family protein [Caldilineaceae bacterium]